MFINIIIIYYYLILKFVLILILFCLKNKKDLFDSDGEHDGVSDNSTRNDAHYV